VQVHRSEQPTTGKVGKTEGFPVKCWKCTKIPKAEQKTGTFGNVPEIAASEQPMTGKAENILDLTLL
jgi:hypothetical protein